MFVRKLFRAAAFSPGLTAQKKTAQITPQDREMLGLAGLGPTRLIRFGLGTEAFLHRTCPLY